jgi:diguanylate cyclase (GGDEF)-like protein
MEFLAMHDGLTGLFNRRAIEGKIGSELSFASQGKRTLSLILLDIDHFKAINDQYGHQAGDDTLRQLAQVLTENLRQYDCAGRWGGEEFILILPGTNLSEASTIAERLRIKTSETKFLLENSTPLSVRISLGIACVSDHYPSLSKFVDAADQALYQAKQSGRNRVCSFNQPIE